MLERAPELERVGSFQLPPAWLLWFEKLRIRGGAVGDSGTTANRPTSNLYIGRPYFDTTLGQPIWYDGSGWVDATGASA